MPSVKFVKLTCLQYSHLIGFFNAYVTSLTNQKLCLLERQNGVQGSRVQGSWSNNVNYIYSISFYIRGVRIQELDCLLLHCQLLNVGRELSLGRELSTIRTLYRWKLFRDFSQDWYLLCFPISLIIKYKYKSFGCFIWCTWGVISLFRKTNLAIARIWFLWLWLYWYKRLNLSTRKEFMGRTCNLWLCSFYALSCIFCPMCLKGSFLQYSK